MSGVRSIKGWVVVGDDNWPYAFTFAARRKDACEKAVDGFFPKTHPTWSSLKASYPMRVIRASIVPEPTQ